ncbi:MAG: dam [Acidobacteriaceae bacterium]|nr:dam [Acidobacteriaceae bacterium]
MISKDLDAGDLPRPKPFLKWPGGKRWLWATLQAFIPAHFRRYYEPFLGGGAIFFALRPRRAILSDINPDLINAYIQVRDNLEEVIAGLAKLKINQATYDRIRKAHLTNDVARAVRLIYLSKTAFNGVYRVNQQGTFNVPFARQLDRKVFDAGALADASRYLQKSQLLARPFAKMLESVREGDFVYCDPPYTVRHNNNGFLRYNESLFSWADQKLLAQLARVAMRRGAHVVVSNAGTDHVRALYKGFQVVTVNRPSCMSALPDGRREVSEFLFIGRA